MKIKYLIIGLALLCLNSSLWSQNITYRKCLNCSYVDRADTGKHHTDTTLNHYIYATRDSLYNPIHTSSDYGPRDLGANRYNWHGGVDYSPETGNQCIGDGIMAIEGGSVAKIFFRAGSNGYKYIIINGNTSRNGIPYDFGYGHIFRSDTGDKEAVGGFTWRRVINHPNQLEKYAIELPNGDIISEDSTYQVINRNNDTVRTRSIVNRGEMIAPIGSSINQTASSWVTAHLHLYCFANNNFSTSDGNTKNPLEFINYVDSGYTTSMHTCQMSGSSISANNALGMEIAYPGSVASKALLKATINGAASGNKYSTSIADIERVSWQIRTPSSAFGLIEGGTYRSEITYGGRINTQIYPEPIKTTAGNCTRTGIEPWAYSDTRQRPWDYFSFADFVTRIHRNDRMGDSTTQLAASPLEARYPDGQYQAVGIVEDVRGNRDSSSVYNLTIDNFKPFVQSLEVDINGTPMYDMDWLACATGISAVGGVRNTQYDRDQVLNIMTVRVQTSEKMRTFQPLIRIGQNPILNFNMTTTDSIHWVIRLDVSQYLDLFNESNDSSGLRFGFEFTGQDFHNRYGDGSAGNALLDFTNHYNPVSDACGTVQTNCLAIPMRNGNAANSWTNNNIPSGTDRSHYFYIRCLNGEVQPRSGDPACLLVDFEQEVDNCALQFRSLAAQENQHFWEFGDGNTSREVNPSHAYAEDGKYTVRLTVSDCEGNVASVSDTVEVEKCEMNCSQRTIKLQVSPDFDGDGKEKGYLEYSTSNSGYNNYVAEIRNEAGIVVASKTYNGTGSSWFYFELPRGKYTAKLTSKPQCVWEESFEISGNCMEYEPVNVVDRLSLFPLPRTCSSKDGTIILTDVSASALCRIFF